MRQPQYSYSIPLDDGGEIELTPVDPRDRSMGFCLRGPNIDLDCPSMFFTHKEGLELLEALRELIGEED